MIIQSAKPYFDDINKILRDTEKILKSGRLILGPYTEKFENAFSEYIGVGYAITVSSATAALELILRYWNIQGGEVIVPANTFIACPNAVIYAGGKPVFCDTNPETFCMDPGDVQEKINPKTKVVMAVHLAGLPVPEIEEIKDICADHKLFLLEDSSHAHGAIINGKKVGSIGDAGCFSLYPTKIMTSGVGGVITTNDKDLRDFAISVRHHGQGKSLDDIINFGNDWLIDEVRSVMGFYQLKNLEKYVKKRNIIAQKYMQGIDKIETISYYKPPKNVRHSYYKFIAKVDKNIKKEKILNYMKDRGIEVSTLYTKPVYHHRIYQKSGYKKGLCPKTEEALRHQISLPVHVRMIDNDVNLVLKRLSEALSVVQVKT